jgi:hypothetical protein
MVKIDLKAMKSKHHEKKNPTTEKLEKEIKKEKVEKNIKSLD